MNTVKFAELSTLSAAKLSVLIELTKPENVIGWNKNDMIQTLLDQVSPERLTKAYEVLQLGLDGLLSGVGATTPRSPASGDASLDAVIRNIIDAGLEEKAQELVSKLEPPPAQIRTLVVRDKVEVDMGEAVLPEQFDWIVSLAAQRLNILLVGPAGSGKTYLAHKVSEALGLNFGSISVTVGMSKSDLLGYLLPVGDSGRFEYVPSTFVDIYENGGVFLLDEVDNADANTLGILNQALANDSFYLPQRIGKHQVKKHPDFVCIAAANTFGTGADAMYVGRNQLDAATLDRFTAGRVVVDYSDRVEEAYVDPELLRWGRGVREKIKDLGLRRILSTRVLLDFTKLKKAENLSLSQIKEVYFQDWSANDRAKVQ